MESDIPMRLTIRERCMFTVIFLLMVPVMPIVILEYAVAALISFKEAIFK